MKWNTCVVPLCEWVASTWQIDCYICTNLFTCEFFFGTDVTVWTIAMVTRLRIECESNTANWWLVLFQFNCYDTFF